MRTLFLLIIICLNLYSFAQIKDYTTIKANFELAIVNNNQSQKKKLAKALVSKYSKNELFYYKTLLKSITNKSLLITNGTDDTFPLIILQELYKLKTNTDIVSLALLEKHSEYSNEIFSKYKLSNDFDKTSKSIFLARLLKQTKVKNYISTTIKSSVYQKQYHNLFLIGLVFEYKSNNQIKKLNNFYSLTDNLIERAALLSSKDKKLYSNYLPALLTYYKLNLHSVKSALIEQKILKISKALGKVNEVSKIINLYKKEK